MKSLQALLVVLFLPTFVACTSDESPQTQTASDSGLGIPSGTYSVDKSHTYLTFSYLHQGLSYPMLRAKEIDGELELNTGAMEKTRVGIVVNADSIRTNIPFFDKELASPKFLMPRSSHILSSSQTAMKPSAHPKGP